MATAMDGMFKDQYGGLTMSHTNEIIDQSRSHDAEKVVEVSPGAGRYVRLNTLLGKGAYKVVYKAIDREEGYEVAWNTIQTVQSLAQNKDLEHEIEILKSVRHPNIIAFHDAWYAQDEFVFITELMTSGTLREYIRKLSLPNLKIVKRWSRQILKGLVYLHGHNPPIIHRDIKCDNIFINGAYGEVKIGDMGTAEMKLGKKYTVIGTPEFMAPEMYDEQGYNEKVDIYAFGMCLLEMATGEYPYIECTNAAQIYKKVTKGLKPNSLQKVQSPEVLGIIENCLGPEEERLAAQEILEHPFLAVEPELVFLSADPTNVHLSFQVVFKGVDKRSVKFDYMVDSDTAESVVREMIEEQVLPERYQQHITKELKRLLREQGRPQEYDQIHRSVWRRESESVQSELNEAKLDLQRQTEHIREIEAKCEEYKNRTAIAEARYRNALRVLRELQNGSESGKRGSEHDAALDNKKLSIDTSGHEAYKPEGMGGEPMTATPSSGGASEHGDTKRPGDSLDHTSSVTPETLVSHILEEYSDDTSIEVFVRDCAIASHRGADKAAEWIKKLHNQDIVTVGDLRDLHDEDWAQIGLTVFALRALKNMLKGKNSSGNSTTSTGHISPPVT